MSISRLKFRQKVYQRSGYAVKRYRPKKGRPGAVLLQEQPLQRTQYRGQSSLSGSGFHNVLF